MEKCEEKMLLQNGKLEKLETELVHVKEENISLNTEIQLNQVGYSMIIILCRIAIMSRFRNQVPRDRKNASWNRK